jgi:hypothetical protein
MRWGLLTLVLVAGCGEVPQSANAVEPRGTPMAKADGEIPSPPVNGVCGDKSCESSKREFVEKDWPAAWAGDYQAQRNVAFCLSNGCSGAVEVIDSAACAWRMVILDSAHDQADDTDESNRRVDCGRLDAVGLEAARAKAQSLSLRITANRNVQISKPL